MSWHRIKAQLRSSGGSVALVIFFILLIVVPLGIMGWYFKNIWEDEMKNQQLKNQIWRQQYDDAKNRKDDWTYIPPDQPVPEDYNYNGFADLYNQNRDFVGWLTIDDTVIDYPVMQTRVDEEYYIHRDFYGDYSNSGTLFMNAGSDARIPTTNIIIFGHHMQAGTMFGSLQKYYKNYDAYSEHKFIKFNTIWGDGLYEVVGAYYTTADDQIYDCVWLHNESEFSTIWNHISSKSVFTADSQLQYGDVFITLSTCAYHTENGRFVVVAKKVA